jgi:hypothetical protein
LSAAARIADLTGRANGGRRHAKHAQAPARAPTSGPRTSQEGLQMKDPRDAVPDRASGVVTSDTLTLNRVTPALSYRGGDPIATTRPIAAICDLLIGRVGRPASRSEQFAAAIADGATPSEARAAWEKLPRVLEMAGARHLLALGLNGGRRLLGESPGLRRMYPIERDAANQVVRVSGSRIDLPAQAVAVLDELLRLPGWRFTFAQLGGRKGPCPSIAAATCAVAELAHALNAHEPAPLAVDRGGVGFALEQLGLVALGPLTYDAAADCARIEDREAPASPNSSRLLTAFLLDPDVWIDLEQWARSAGYRVKTVLTWLVEVRATLRRLVHQPDQRDVIVGDGNGRFMLPLENVMPGWFDLARWTPGFDGLATRDDTRALRHGRAVAHMGPQAHRLARALALAGGARVDAGLLIHTVCDGAAKPGSLHAARMGLQAALDRADIPYVVRSQADQWWIERRR